MKGCFYPLLPSLSCCYPLEWREQGFWTGWQEVKGSFTGTAQVSRLSLWAMSFLVRRGLVSGWEFRRTWHWPFSQKGTSTQTGCFEGGRFCPLLPATNSRFYLYAYRYLSSGCVLNFWSLSRKHSKSRTCSPSPLPCQRPTKKGTSKSLLFHICFQ